MQVGPDCLLVGPIVPKVRGQARSETLAIWAESPASCVECSAYIEDDLDSLGPPAPQDTNPRLGNSPAFGVESGGREYRSVVAKGP